MALTPTTTGPSRGGDQDDRKLSAEDEVVIREIDDAVRQDDTMQFFKKYGTVLIGGVVMLLVGLGGYLLWDSQVESGLEAESEQLVGVLDYAQAEDFAAVKERTQPLLDSDTPGVRTSARFLQAAAALELGETARAVELYASIAADEEAPPAMRDLALIREVSSNFDNRKPADIIARLKDIAVPGNAFFGSAGELTAIAHLEAGNRSEAGALFAAIAKDENLPESLRSRARQMSGLLGIDAIVDVEKLLEDEGVNPAGAGPDAAIAPASAAAAPQAAQ